MPVAAFALFLATRVIRHPQMTKSSKILVAVMALLTVGMGATAYVLHQQAGQAVPPTLAPAFPGLAAELAGVEKVTLQSGKHLTTLQRAGDVWTVAEFDGFPADPAAVRRALYDMAGWQLVEPRTANPQLFSRLGLDQPTQPESRAVLVRLTGKDGKVLAAAYRGDPATGMPTGNSWFFLRRENQDQAWLARGEANSLSAEPTEWIRQDAINIDQERVSRVTVTSPEGQRVTVSRATPFDTKFKAEGGNDGDGSALEQSTADAVGSVLAFVRFENVRKPDPEAATPDKVTLAEVTTFDGLNVTLRMDGNGWTRLAARTVPPADPKAWQDAAKGADRKDLPLKTGELVADEAKRINSIGENWQVKLQPFKAERLQQAAGK